MIFVLPKLLILAETVWQVLIKYPPTLEQLSFGITNPVTLWTTRLVSLALLVSATFFYSRALSPKSKKYYWILILAAPVFSFIWMSHPGDAFRIFIISAIYYIVSAQKIKWRGIAWTLIIILTLNLVVFKQNPRIIETVTLKAPQEEVVLRFNAEDNLNPNIEIPVQLKRTVYNKFFIALKNSFNESLTFFDFETLFFQEVHPMGQKAFVIFFWPQIFIAGLGIWHFLNNRSGDRKSVVFLFFLSFVYFMTTNTSAERRLLITMFPLAILMSDFLGTALQKNSKVKFMAVLFLSLTAYGWATNIMDRTIRPSYWLDNRPIAYDFSFAHLSTTDQEYGQVIFSEALYSANEYCRYYSIDCSKILVNKFDLSIESINRDTLYIGFTGNFLGPSPDNSFPDNLAEELGKKGLEIVDQHRAVNNIANTLGQDILIARAKR
jgi:hypothetical protein